MDFSQVSKRLNIAIIADHMLEGRSLESLSVEELCRGAGISRSTFYRLYSDRYKVATWWQDVFFMAGIRQIGRAYTWRDGLLISISGQKLLPSLARACQGLDDYNANQRVGRRHYRECLVDTLVNHHGRELTDDLSFQIDFYTEMETHVIDGWVRDGLQTPVAVLAGRLVACVPSALREAIDITESARPVKELDFASAVLVAQEVGDQMFDS